MSSLTHCSHVFLLRPRPLVPSTTNPLQADTQSSTLLRSRCPNHLNLPRLTTSATQLIPRRLHKSSLRFLSFKDTPHIHLTIIRSVLSRLLRSSAFIAHCRLLDFDFYYFYSCHIKWHLVFDTGLKKFIIIIITFWPKLKLYGMQNILSINCLQCIPTPVAWYLYQAPLWFHKVCLVITFVIQLLIPFLFFSPVRSHRKFAFYCQVIGSIEYCGG